MLTAPVIFLSKRNHRFSEILIPLSFNVPIKKVTNYYTTISKYVTVFQFNWFLCNWMYFTFTLKDTPTRRGQ